MQCTGMRAIKEREEILRYKAAVRGILYSRASKDSTLEWIVETFQGCVQTRVRSKSDPAGEKEFKFVRDAMQIEGHLAIIEQLAADDITELLDSLYAHAATPAIEQEAPDAE